MKPIMNIADVELQPRLTAFARPESMNDRYGGVRMGMIGQHIGAQRLGYNVTAVPPGKRAFPFHNRSDERACDDRQRGTSAAPMRRAITPARCAR